MEFQNPFVFIANTLYKSVSGSRSEHKLKAMKNIKTIIGILFLGLMTQLSFAGGGGSIKGNLVDEIGGAVMFANVFFYEGGALRGDVSEPARVVAPINVNGFNLIWTLLALGPESIIMSIL